VGTPLRRLLKREGHRVVALTRSEESASALRGEGHDAVVADVFDERAVGDALERARPDVVIHQLTAIPPRISPRHAVRDLAATNRLREEGTRILLRAAIASGATRFIAQSISFVHRAEGAERATEGEPIWLDPPGFAPIHRAVASLEEQVASAELHGVVLRYGSFYGPRTVYAPDGSFHADVLARRVPIVGRGRGVFSFVHVEDAARAALLALTASARGVFHVVDDDPAPVSEWLPVYCDAIGARAPYRIPAWLARIGAGPYGLYLMEQQRAISNRAAREALGWTPSIPSWRAGFRSRLDA
jgi:nucleoside-diphosphate-sugar epimerase